MKTIKKSPLVELSSIYSKKMEDLLNPLKIAYGIDSFFYTIYIPEEKKASFTSNKPFFVEKIEKIGRFSKNHDEVLSTIKEGSMGKFIWPQYPDPDNEIGRMFKAEGVKIGLSFLHRLADGSVKNVGFASTSHNHDLINTFINKSEVFVHFISYFESEGYKIIEELKKIFISFNMEIKKTILDLTEKETKECIKSMRIKKFYISELESEHSPYLTPREFQCLFLLCKGESIKQIGKSLQLSSRTVETYIISCKEKFQVFNKFELVKKAMKINIDKYMHSIDL